MTRTRVAPLCAVFTLAAAAAASIPAAAQAPLSLTPRALGMGGAYVAVARGQESLFQNPANLGLPNTSHWSIAFPQVMAGGTISGLRFGDLRDVADRDDISDSRARELLAKVPAEGTQVRYDLRAPVAAIQAGRFAFGASYATFGDHGASRDLMELVLLGYELGRTDYSIEGTEGFRGSYLDFAAAHGRRFGPVSVGITGHYYRGGTLVASRLLDVEATGLTATAEYFGLRSRGGTGYGVDLGVALQPMPGLTLSGSVANAIGEMRWNRDLRQRRLVLTERDIEDGEFQDFELRWAASDSAYAGSTDPAVQALAAGIFRDTDLPRTARVGAAWDPGTGTVLAASVTAELGETRVGGMWSRALSVGVQQRVPFTTLRAGLSTDLDDGLMLGGGLNLGPIQLGVARLVDGESRTGWVATFGVQTRSNSTMP